MKFWRNLISVQHDSENSMFSSLGAEAKRRICYYCLTGSNPPKQPSLANRPSFLPCNCAALSHKETDAVMGGSPRRGIMCIGTITEIPVGSADTWSKSLPSEQCLFTVGSNYPYHPIEIWCSWGNGYSQSCCFCTHPASISSLPPKELSPCKSTVNLQL